MWNKHVFFLEKKEHLVYTWHGNLFHKTVVSFVVFSMISCVYILKNTWDENGHWHWSTNPRCKIFSQFRTGSPGWIFLASIFLVSFINDPLKRLQNHIPKLDSHQEKNGNTWKKQRTISFNQQSITKIVFCWLPSTGFVSSVQLAEYRM